MDLDWFWGILPEMFGEIHVGVNFIEVGSHPILICSDRNLE